MHNEMEPSFNYMIVAKTVTQTSNKLDKEYANDDVPLLAADLAAAFTVPTIEGSYIKYLSVALKSVCSNR